MKSGHTFPWVLPSKTIVAGQNDIIEGKLLPKMLFGQIVHLESFQATAEFTPTFTAAPTTNGNQALYARFDFYDGVITRFTGGWQALRASQRLQEARVINADADTDTASASARVLRQTLRMGPSNYAGSPSDFLMPAGALETAELRLQVGALTDLSSDTTALTGTTRIMGNLKLLPAEVRFCPVYEVRTQKMSGADAQLQGRALYDYIGVTKTDYSTIAAGAVSTVNLDLGAGLIVPGINARDLTGMFLADKLAGEFAQVMGEPLGASDDNVKQVNRGTPAAIVGATADLQPILWSNREAFINKRPLAQSSARLYFTGGSVTDFLIHTGKFLPQSKSAVGAMVAKAFSKLPFQPKNVRIKTLSKDSYSGPFTEFMPWCADI